MKYLQDYIDNKNAWTRFFNAPAINFPLTQAEVKSLAGGLDSDLSPENLHCDGEISHAAAERKYQYYGKVIKDLDRYCANQGLTMPKIYEYY
jgi:hypothetical protein